MSARAGTGVVVAKLPSGEWSAPAAVGLGGLGGGFNAGAEMVDLLIVLNSRAAVRTFMTQGSLQLGGNLSLAVGPLGRTGEVNAAVSSEMEMSAMYSYSVSRGLYGGATIEGTVLIERTDSNARAYGRQVTAKEVLGGRVPVPDFALPLVSRIAQITGSGQDPMPDLDYDYDSPGSSQYSGLDSAAGNARDLPYKPRTRARPSGVDPMDDLDVQLQRSATISSSETSSPVEERPRSRAPPVRRQAPASDDPFADQGGADELDADDDLLDAPVDRPRRAPTYEQPRGVAAYAPGRLRPDSGRKEGQRPLVSPRLAMAMNAAKEEDRAETEAQQSDTAHFANLDDDLVLARFDFDPVQSGDLGFKRGDVIRVLHRTGSSEDWWRGEITSRSGEVREGMFPSNYTEPL